MLGTIIGLIFALIVLGVLIVLWVIATLLQMAGLPVHFPRF